MSKTTDFTNTGSVCCQIAWLYKFDVSAELTRICGAELGWEVKDTFLGLPGCITPALCLFTVVWWEAYTAARGYVWYFWYAKGLCFAEK